MLSGKHFHEFSFERGLTPYFNIVLFGEDAANPHGGVDESRQLEECEFVLIDVGSSLPTMRLIVGAVFHGYSSDITRTFLPKRTNIADCVGNHSLQDLWTTVYNAQSAAISTLLQITLVQKLIWLPEMS